MLKQAIFYFLLLIFQFNHSALANPKLGIGGGLYYFAHQKIDAQEAKDSEDPNWVGSNRPFVFVFTRFDLGRSTAFTPEFGFVFGDESTSLKWKDLFVNADFSFRLSKKLFFRFGPGMIRRWLSTRDDGIEDPSGAIAVSGSKTIVMFVINAGLEVLMDRFLLRGELSYERIFSSTREGNALLSLGYLL